MPKCIFDDPFSRRLASFLEYNHIRRLGIRNIMRMARVYNRVKNHRFHQFRQELCRRQLEELFAENNSRHDAAFGFNAAAKMTDGWALDESQTLPYLDRLLAAAREIIQEPGGLKGRPYRITDVGSQRASRTQPVLKKDPCQEYAA